MGEDLSITLRVLPSVSNLVITPEIVYHYRIGGGTSKFIPSMMDDFISLYNFKKECATIHVMPQNAIWYMNVELMNITYSYYEMCINSKLYSNKQILQEINKVINLPEVIQAASYIIDSNEKTNAYYIAEKVLKKDSNAILCDVKEIIKKNKLKKFIKHILMSI